MMPQLQPALPGVPPATSSSPGTDFMNLNLDRKIFRTIFSDKFLAASFGPTSIQIKTIVHLTIIDNNI
jgi:hypothetical protein